MKYSADIRSRGLMLASGTRAFDVGRIGSAGGLFAAESAANSVFRSSTSRSYAGARSTRIDRQPEVRRHELRVLLVARIAVARQDRAETVPGIAIWHSRATTAESRPPLKPTTTPRALGGGDLLPQSSRRCLRRVSR